MGVEKIMRQSAVARRGVEGLWEMGVMWTVSEEVRCGKEGVEGSSVGDGAEEEDGGGGGLPLVE